MKCQIAALAITLSVGLVPASLAQSGGVDAGHDTKHADAQKAHAQTYKASGTVTKVDQPNGKVTIAHGPVESLKWPAMTMNFIVIDKALLGKLSTGKKVDFEFVQHGRDYVITSAK